jgi:thioredoxin reductase
MPRDELPWDVLIIGGGPAGLSAALFLVRACRRVIVFDAGKQRNRHSRRLNGFLTRDRTPPSEFLRLAREELRTYETIELHEQTAIVDALPLETGFEVTTQHGARFRGRKLLFATGVEDILPPIAGIDMFYGQSIWHCPYCDGYEHRDQRIAVYGSDQPAYRLVLELRGWTRHLILLAGGLCEIAEPERQRLSDNGVSICEDKIVRLEGSAAGRLRRIVLSSGDTIEADALFFPSEGAPAGKALMGRLGVALEQDARETANYGKTGVKGVFLAGDDVRHVQLAIVAAGEGAAAAFAINTELIKEILK